VGAALSGLATIPLIGMGATALKGIKMSDKMREALKIFENLATACDKKNSFGRGTPVLMADGTRKPIERVRVGDRILSTQPGSWRTATKVVTATIKGTGDKDLVDLTLDTDGDAGTATAKLTTTAHHLFWSARQRGWVEATTLAAGMAVRGGDGARLEVEKVERRAERATVYNLTVSDFHTYYVGAGQASVLTHNCLRSDFDNLANGNSRGVKVVSNATELRALFDKWKEGAEQLPARGEKIPEVYKLEDGTVIQWRLTSASGGETIDIVRPGARQEKVHLG